MRTARVAVPDTPIRVASREEAFAATAEDPAADERYRIWLVHAMQGRDGAWSDTRTKTLDAWLAARAVTEGEAAYLEDRVRLALFGATDGESVPWDRVFSTWQTTMRAHSRVVDNPVALASGFFPYAFGEPYVRAAWRAGGPEAVRALILTPPRTTRRVMTGETGFAADDLAAAESVAAHALPILPGLTLAASDALGAWIFEGLLARAGVLDHAPRAPFALAADRFSVFTTADRGVAVAWRLRFDDEATADAVVAALASAAPARTVTRRWNALRFERDVVLFEAEDPDIAAQLEASTPFEAVRGAGTGSDAESASAVRALCRARE